MRFKTNLEGFPQGTKRFTNKYRNAAVVRVPLWHSFCCPGIFHLE